MMKEYCADCQNKFDAKDLESCICDIFIYDITIVTKGGVKQIKSGSHCKNCMKMKHEHKGQTFI